MRTKKWIVTALLVSLAVSSVTLARAIKPTAHFKIDKRDSARSLGKPGAPVWVVEYMDFQCPTCRAAGPFMKKWMERFPGKIHYQVKFDPLVNSHKYALKSAIYAECAARQDKFWPLHDKLFEVQEKWSASDDPDNLFRELSGAAGIDVKKLVVCVDDPEVKKTVLAEREQAISLGVKGTPTFFVNGKMAVGVPPLDQELKEVLEGTVSK